METVSAIGCNVPVGNSQDRQLGIGCYNKVIIIRYYLNTNVPACGKPPAWLGGSYRFVRLDVSIK